MGLSGIDVRKPIVRIKVVAGAQELTSSLLENNLMKFQYISRKGKGQVPKIIMEFDNSSGLVFNPLVLAAGLKLSIRFGYEGYLSRTITAPVKAIRANCLVDPGRQPQSPRPDAYGTVVMEMHLHKALTHLRPSEDAFTAAGPMRISDAIYRLAKQAGYRDDQIHIQKGLGMISSNGGEEPIVDLAQIPEGETMLQYLRKKAVERGFYLSVTEEEFRFHRPDWKFKPVDVFSYMMGPDVLSMAVEGDYAVNTSKVTGKAYDPMRGCLVQYVADRNTGFPLGVFASKPIQKGGAGAAAPKDPEAIDPHDFVTTVSSKLAEATTKRLYEAANNRWVIKLKVVGDPVVFENDAVVLDNFGPVVDGCWMVNEIEHRIDSDGYTTEMTLKGKPGGKSAPIWPIYVYDPNTGFPIGLYAQLAGDWSRDKKGNIRMKKAKGNKQGRSGRVGMPLFKSRGGKTITYGK